MDNKLGRLFIYARALHVGGGLQVGINLCRALAHSEAFDEITIMAPTGRGYENLATENVKVLHAETKVKSVLESREYIKNHSTDYVLNLCNIAIPISGRSIKKPKQYLLIHRPHHLYYYDDYKNISSLALRFSDAIKQFMFKFALRYSDYFLVQTDYAAEKFTEQYNRPARILPNAVPTFLTAIANPENIKKEHLDVLLLTRYYRHKNLEIIIDVIDALGEDAKKFRFNFTLDGKTMQSERDFLEKLQPYIDRGLATNLGRVEHSNLPKVYSQNDILAMPTLLESFSTTYLEAMHFKKSIITSDRGFATTVCDDAAIYVDPHDAKAIAEKLLMLYYDENLRAQLVEKGSKRLSEFMGWDEINSVLLQYIEADSQNH